MVDTEARTATHPLEPLSVDEISVVAGLLLDGGRVGERPVLAWVALKELPKSDVLAWTADGPLTRRAVAVSVDRATGVTYESVVNLSEGVVEQAEAKRGAARCHAVLVGGLPTGVVSFVLTEVVGSTELCERAPDVMAVALTRHEELVTAAVEGEGGALSKARWAMPRALAARISRSTLRPAMSCIQPPSTWPRTRSSGT